MERNIISLGIRVEIYIFFNWNGGNRSSSLGIIDVRAVVMGIIPIQLIG